MKSCVSMEKLQLNDASLCFTRKFSGIRFWFPLWILGMLHGNYSRALEREFDMTVITTVPNVSYLAFTKDPETLLLSIIHQIYQNPLVRSCWRTFYQSYYHYQIWFVGNVMSLCIENVGYYKSNVFDYRTCRVKFDMPLAEIVFDFTIV
jgi:GTP-binding protein LepA